MYEVVLVGTRIRGVTVGLISTRPVKALKGHSQLMHMRIRYYFLADLYVTRRA